MKKLFPKFSRLIVLLLISTSLLAQNTGPAAPEAMSFEPVDAANMVNLNTGDFVYTIPIINIPGPGGGYPLALSYHGGIAMDQEASWVGLGWTLNPGAINRGVLGIPDDLRNGKTFTTIYNYGGSYTVRSVSVGITIEGITAGTSLTWNSNWSKWTLYNYAGVGFGDAMSANAGLVIGTEFGVKAGVGKEGLGYVGVGIGTWGFSGTLGFGPASITQNFTTGETSFGVSIPTGSSRSDVTPAIGTPGIGVGVTLGSDGNISGGFSVGVSSFQVEKATNYSEEGEKLDHTSRYIPLIFFNYSYDNYRFWYFDNQQSTANGMLYLSDSYVTDDSYPMQSTSYTADVLVMPYSLLEISDPDQKECSSNLMLPGYDQYSVNAQGLNGNMSLKYYEPSLLVGQSKDIIANGEKKVEYSTVAGYPDGSPSISYDQTMRKMPESVNPYFYFNNSPTSSISISPLTFENFDSGDNDPYWGDYRLNTIDGSLKTTPSNMKNGRKVDGNYVQYFTNSEINADIELCRSKGFIETSSIVEGEGRSNPSFFEEDGIGAFMITSNDGITYHYSLPVYQFEEFKSHDPDDNTTDYYVQVQTDYYAYTWLLTAITGPDYIDKGTVGLDEADEGYWVNFKYGKWTDSYVWKTPFDDAEFETFGRKQIYYLNSIETKTHEALFVKEIRSDAHSKNIDKSYSYNEDPEIDWALSIPGSDLPDLDPKDGLEYSFSSIYHLTSIKSAEVFPLRLDRILLVKNEAVPSNLNIRDTWSSNAILSLNSTKTYLDVYRHFNIGGLRVSGIDPIPLGDHIVGPNIELPTYYDQNVIDINDYNALSEKPTVIKEVVFNYDTDNALCKNAPNSPAGKLTLKSVEMLGQNGTPIMPPYVFDYNRHDIYYDRDDADAWGFHRFFEDNWSLNSIQTPLGSTIEIEYESDSYNRFSISDNVFTVLEVKELGAAGVGYDFSIKIPENYDFEKFVNSIDEIDLLVEDTYGTVHAYGPVSGGFNGFINVVSSELSTRMVFFKRVGGLDYTSFRGTKNANFKFYISGDVFKGGGLRTKSITIDNKYKTSYDYTSPSTGITSGVTSYIPFDGYFFLNFPTEVPAPCVYYKNVSVSSGLLTTEYEFEVPGVLSNGNLVTNVTMGSQLEVYDIQNSTDSYNPWVKISTGTYKRDAFARSSVIINKTAKIGQLNSVRTYNTANDIISEEKYEYKDGSELGIGVNQETFYYLKNISDEYAYNNSFYFVSTTKRTEPSILTAIHTTAGNLTNSTYYSNFDVNTGAALKTTTILHKNADVYNYSTIADIPNKIYEASVATMPAYTLPGYASTSGDNESNVGMNSKVYNIHNKNMLTQTAAALTRKNGGLVDVSIQTWKGDWEEDDGKYGYLNWDETAGRYDYTGTDDADGDGVRDKTIWRKHKSFTYKGDLDSDGNYATDITTQDLKTNWDTYFGGEGTADWLKASEIIRYDHYSSPIEVMDINDDYAATKKDPKQLYTVATAANARLSQFAHCSFEYKPYSNHHGEAGCFIVNTENVVNTGISEGAHTGKYYLAIDASATGVEYNISDEELARWDDLGETMTFMASVWVYGAENSANCVVEGPGTSEDLSSFKSGNWVQINKLFRVSAVSDISFAVKNMGGSTIYIDDFRVSPYQAAVTAYTYDETGNVTSISNNDNIATKYTYDDAGRLTATFVEKPTGFEQISSHKYGNRDYLNLAPANVIISNAAQTITVSVNNSQVNWSYGTLPSWITYVQHTSNSISFNVTENEFDYRRGEVEFTSASGSKATLIVEQKTSAYSIIGEVRVYDDVHYAGDPLSFSFDFYGTTSFKANLIGVRHNGAEEISFGLIADGSLLHLNENSYSADWDITDCPDGAYEDDTKMCVAGDWDEFDSYKLKVWDANNSSVVSFSEPFSILPEDLNPWEPKSSDTSEPSVTITAEYLNKNSQSVSLHVNPNCECAWSILTDYCNEDGWLSVEPSSGVGNTLVTLNVDDNTNGGLRTAFISVEIGNEIFQFDLSQSGSSTVAADHDDGC